MFIAHSFKHLGVLFCNICADSSEGSEQEAVDGKFWR